MIDSELIRKLKYFQPKFLKFLSCTQISSHSNVVIYLNCIESYTIELEPSVYSTYGIYKSKFGRMYSFTDKEEMSFVEVKNLIADNGYKNDLFAIMDYIDNFLENNNFNDISERYYS